MFSFASSIRAIPLSSQSALLPSSASDTNVKFYRIEFEELPDVSNELDIPCCPPSFSTRMAKSSLILLPSSPATSRRRSSLLSKKSTSSYQTMHMISSSPLYGFRWSATKFLVSNCEAVSTDVLMFLNMKLLYSTNQENSGLGTLYRILTTRYD
jgi:hypothetical protein